MKYDPSNSDFYKIIVGAVVPRPIAWVSTLSTDGVPNLAPFSFFNIVGPNPPSLLFCPGLRGTDSNPKDTLNNVRATGEYVISLVNEELAEAMNKTATELPPEVNEFEYAGLTPAPSVAVAAPRVAESPVSFECKLSQIVEVGPNAVVIGEVVHIHIADEVLMERNRINLEALKPVARLSGPHYARIRETFELFREPSQIPPR